jgi:hypothetical protein
MNTRFLAFVVAFLTVTKVSALTEAPPITYVVKMEYSKRDEKLHDQCPVKDHPYFGGAPVARKLPMTHNVKVATKLVSDKKKQKIVVNMGAFTTDVTLPFASVPGPVHIRENVKVALWGFLGTRDNVPIEIDGVITPEGFDTVVRLRMYWEAPNPNDSKKPLSGFCYLQYHATGKAK